MIGQKEVVTVLTILLIVAAAVLAALAWLTDTLQYGYAATAASAVGVLLVAGRMLLDRRRRARGAAETGDESEAVDEFGDPDEEVPDDNAPAPAEPTSGEELVRAVPGRKRFHRPECSILSGHASDELTRVEAEEEGLSPCPRCCGAPTAAAS